MGFSNEIKELRTQMKMNRREFCDYFGIPYRTVADWEAGKRTMPAYLLRLMKYKAETEKLVKRDSLTEEEARQPAKHLPQK